LLEVLRYGPFLRTATLTRGRQPPITT
jgi:hypothetical protein